MDQKEVEAPIQPQQPEQPDAEEPPREAEKVEEEEEEYIEVAGPHRMTIADDDEADKMLREIQRKQEERRMALDLMQKNALKKRKSNAVNDKKNKSPLELKTEKILEKIAPLTRKFKSLNYPNHSDTECSKFRFQQKQKLFKYLLYTLEQLRSLPATSLTEGEQKITQLSQDESYEHCKSITTQIDIEFLYILNKGNKQSIGRRFKDQWKNLTQNIEDEHNLPMRRKIISKLWPPKEMATCAETEFYSDKRKQSIRDENDRLLSQAAKIQDKNYVIEEQPVIQYNSEYRTAKKNESSDNKKQGYKYLETSTMTFLRDLISVEKIGRMKSLLQDGLAKNIEQRLVNNLERVLEGKINDN